MQNNEAWKDISGYEGKYQVSSLGRVKSLDRFLPHKTHGTWHIKERILKPHFHGPAGSRYLSVALHSGNGNLKFLSIHRLVAEAFIPNERNLPQVNHKDGNKLNNVVSNLEWVTERQNAQHAWKNGLCAPVLKVKQVPVVNLDTGERFDSISDAERSLGKVDGSIGHVLHGKCERAHGYRWAFVKE